MKAMVPVIRYVRPVRPIDFPSSDPEWDMGQSGPHERLCDVLYSILRAALEPERAGREEQEPEALREAAEHVAGLVEEEGEVGAGEGEGGEERGVEALRAAGGRLRLDAEGHADLDAGDAERGADEDRDDRCHRALPAGAHAAGSSAHPAGRKVEDWNAALRETRSAPSP